LLVYELVYSVLFIVAVFPTFQLLQSLVLTMGASVSLCLLGFHTVLELGAGSAIFATGQISPGMDPKESLKCSGRDRLWKRFHASGLLAMSYVGYIGLANPEVKPHCVHVCALFHAAAASAMVLAAQEGELPWRDATVGNLHIYIALGFAAVGLGIVE
jgi:hypothetical protein